MYPLLWLDDTILFYAAAMLGWLDRPVCSLLFGDGHVIYYAWDVHQFVDIFGWHVHQFVDIFGCKAYYAFQGWMNYSIWLLTFIYALTYCVLEC